jgi:antitoxin (DNA-binding transcriptional repressor) of toxin-antitoxin stability system
MYMAMLTISEARAALPEVVDRVLRGEEITITRHGQPVAVVVRPDTLRARRAAGVFADAERLRDAFEQARRTPLSETQPLTAQQAEELLAEVRASRETR